MPYILDHVQSGAIHGVLYGNQHHRLLETDHDAQVEESFALHFDQRTHPEFSAVRAGRNLDPKPVFFAALNVTGKGVSIRQLPDRRPFIWFGHFFDYTVCPQYLHRGRSTYAGARPPVNDSRTDRSITDRSSEGDKFLM